MLNSTLMRAMGIRRWALKLREPRLAEEENRLDAVRLAAEELGVSSVYDARALLSPILGIGLDPIDEPWAREIPASRRAAQTGGASVDIGKEQDVETASGE